MNADAVARPPLEPVTLQAAAGPDWQVRLEQEVDSTNRVAAEAAQRGLVVVAEHQTAGRGRLDRSWEAPERVALTFSATLEPTVEPQWWPLIPLAAGLAVARAVHPPTLSLKWPNDVLLEGQKLCGILVERVERDRPLAVIGIGLNVHQRPDELPVPGATSLAASGYAYDRTDLLGRILAELRRTMGHLMSDPHGLVATYRGHSATLDRQVRVELPDGNLLEGRAVDIDHHGRLLVAPSAETPREPGSAVLPATVAVAAGDVVHVRPGRPDGRI